MCTIADTTFADRIMRSIQDPFFPEKELAVLHHSLITSWDAQMKEGVALAMNTIQRYGSLQIKEAKAFVDKIGSKVSGAALIKTSVRQNGTKAIAHSWQRAGREVEAEHLMQTNNKNSVSKDDVSIQVVDGMTDFDAINSLSDQVFISAGEFWDVQLQDSIRTEIEGYIQGSSTKEELAGKLKDMVNSRLISEGKNTLADSYFKRLANYNIVKTRTIGKFGKSKIMGAKGMKAINPLDARTSPICRAIVMSGKIYKIDEIQPVVDDILTATSTEELKSRQPFWKSPTEDRVPVFPVHWGDCRSTLVPVFI